MSEATEQVTEEDRGDDLESAPKEEAKAVEPEAKAEPEQEEPEVSSGQTIPFSRFKAQNVRLREFEKRAEELQKQLEELQTTPKEPAAKVEPEAGERDFDAEISVVEKKLEDALADNDAAAIMAANRELRAIDRALHKLELEQIRAETQQTQNTVAERAFEETLTMVESHFP